MILENLKKSRNALAKILNKTFNSLVEKIKEKELTRKDLQMSTYLIESRMGKVAEVDKQINEYIFEEAAGACNESGSTYQEIAQTCRDLLTKVSRNLFVGNEEKMDGTEIAARKNFEKFEIAFTEISKLAEIVQGFCRKIETCKERKSNEINQEGSIGRRDETSKLIIENAMVVIDNKPITGRELDQSEIKVRTGHRRQLIECKESANEELVDPEEAIVTRAIRTEDYIDHRESVEINQEELMNGKESLKFEKSIEGIAIYTHDGGIVAEMDRVGEKIGQHIRVIEDTTGRTIDEAINKKEVLVTDDQSIARGESDNSQIDTKTKHREELAPLGISQAGVIGNRNTISTSNKQNESMFLVRTDPRQVKICSLQPTNPVVSGFHLFTLVPIGGRDRYG